MLTFLPFPDFEKSAKSLDRQRLGKQRVECKQILATLHGYYDSWASHPAVKMWDGYTDALAVYAFAIIKEWTGRNYKDMVWLDVLRIMDWTFGDLAIKQDNHELPPWFGNEAFHRSHRSNLIKKLPSWYRDQQGWSDPDDLPYIWPV